MGFIHYWEAMGRVQKFCFIIFFTSITAIGGLAYAQEETTKFRIVLPKKKKSAEIKKNRLDKKLKFKFKMRQQEYLTKAPDKSQPNRIYSMGGQMEYYRSHKYFTNGLDIQLVSAERESEKPYLSIADFYMGIDASPWVDFHLGRKKQSWSALDEQWKLGVWQPIARWDYIHPQELGLTGVFLNVGNEFVRLKGFGSPFFLPDQGPNFELKDGRFQSNNRWFWTPQTQIGVLSQPSNLFFDLERPSEEDVIMNNGYVAALEFGNPEFGLWARGSYARKPRNQLHLGIDGEIILPQENRISVTIHPEIVYHQVTTVEAGLSSPEISFWGSVSKDTPEDPNLPEDWVQSELSDMIIYGGFLEHSVGFLGVKRAKISYAYMEIEEGRNIAENTILGGNVDSSLDRFMFERVFSTEWVHAIPLGGRRLFRYGIKYMYSIPDEAGLFSTQLEFLLSRSLTMDFSADILGANEDASNAGTGLMTRYRSNDRVSLGMTYVF